MKLFLDDIRNPPDNSWTIARTADVAIEFLKTGAVEEISFDHDLGEKFGTGYDVAAYIEEEVYFGRMTCPKWGVHSANPVGTANIKVSMHKAEYFQKQQNFP